MMRLTCFPAFVVAILLSACTTGAANQTAQAIAPATASQATEARIDALLARMTLDQKVGQIIMPDISAITPADVRTYRFGTILNGGNSGPGGNERAAPVQWLALADAYWEASTTPTGDDSPVIPVLWATDAVHGHNNVVGATIFPHNIALGATGNADLVRRIGTASAAEIAATGIDWTFAPTLAVVRDDRWGRTYEGFSEDPKLVTLLGAAAIEGLQGKPGTAEFLDQRHVIATAKHFFGDGGTGGIDQGDTKGDTAAIEALHGAPYPAALAAGTQTVMASFSSINGRKMHGNGTYLTGLLKQQWGFGGLVVGDWNGHGQLPGCTNTDCPDSLLAGVDVYMVPEDWKGLHATLIGQVKSGRVPLARLDDAVRRVLRVKFAYGLFEKPRPSARALGGQFDQLGSPAHRVLARDAVRQSLVLLKNDGVLPIKPGKRILVAGDAADDIARQSGGWTISWQGGGDLTNADFPGAQSIYDGISAAAEAVGSTVALSPDGSFVQRPDVAIVVFGETPYAEFSGDIKTLVYANSAPLQLMRRLKAQGIPVVAVFLSGRPLWVNRELNQADAFVAAWLPGSEGGGIADLLLTGPSGRAAFDFTGRLPFSWPRLCDQYSLNAGEPSYDPLFPLGFGLTYRQTERGPILDENCAAFAASSASLLQLIAAGRPVAPAQWSMFDQGGSPVAITGSSGRTPLGLLTMVSIDRRAQEDARRFTFSGPASIAIEAAWNHNQWSKLESGSFTVEFSVSRRPIGTVRLVARCGPNCGGEADITKELALAEGKGWRTLTLPIHKLISLQQAAGGATIQLQSSGALEISVSSINMTSP
jgi:beta-glucosidase